MKGLLRRSIAATLEVTMADYRTSAKTRATVDRWLSVVMAISARETLDEAMDDLCERGSFFNAVTVPRRLAKAEVEACCNIFRFEVAAFTKAHDMERCGMEPEGIWNYLISVVCLPDAYQDNWLEQAHARWSASRDSEDVPERSLDFALPCLAA
ncbi:MAG: hypothetical protein ACRD41_08955 [Candidatus Acidiferrales bacterium]